MKHKVRALIVVALVLAIFATACGPSEAELELQALYAQFTAEALAAQTEEAPTVFSEPDHALVPGNPGPPDQTKDDIDTSSTAEDKTTVGDSSQMTWLMTTAQTTTTTTGTTAANIHFRRPPDC